MIFEVTYELWRKVNVPSTVWRCDPGCCHLLLYGPAYMIDIDRNRGETLGSYEASLYRHECFTGKYTARKTHTKLPHEQDDVGKRGEERKEKCREVEEEWREEGMEEGREGRDGRGGGMERGCSRD